MKFTHSHTDYDNRVLETISIEISEHSTLTEALDAFERFLKAVGYVFDGNINIVNEDEQQLFNDLDDTFDSVHYDDYQPQFEGPVEGFSDSLQSTEWPFPTKSKP
jgi:hypothetical protein